MIWCHKSKQLLFIDPKAIAFTHLNDLPIYSDFIKKIKAMNIQLRCKGMTEGFLGIAVKQDEKTKMVAGLT